MNRIMILIAIAILIGSGCNSKTPVVEISAAESGIVVSNTRSTDIDLPWPEWRGGNQGVATDAQPPTTWNKNENIRWQADVPGRGHSSPIVVGDLIVLGTATEQPPAQSVVAYSRDKGEKVWETVVHSGSLPATGKLHQKSTHANGTVASDGTALVTAHLNGDHIWVTALGLDGQQLWQTDIGAFNSKFGYAPSPIIYKSLAIVAADNRGGGYLVGLDLKSGEIAWRRARDNVSTYSSPTIATLDGVDQVLITGMDRMSSYSPSTGDLIWETKCIAEATCGTVVATKDHVFGSGGYPDKQTVCLDTSGKLIWSNRTKIYEPSMVTDGVNLFAISDAGIAYCWSVIDGAERWKKRLGGSFSSSPIIANGLVYVSDLAGNTHVFRADGEKFDSVAKNKLGDNIYASPAIAGKTLMLRVGIGEGADRREKLYCISEQ